MNVNRAHASSLVQSDVVLMHLVRDASKRIGDGLMQSFSPGARPVDKEAMFKGGTALRAAVEGPMKAALTAIRPEARWVDEAHEKSALLPGEWWLVDEVEGAVNYLHGVPEWAVSVTLIRENATVLSVVYQPAAQRMYTAVRGAGAFLNGERLQVSPKQALGDAVVTTLGTGSDDPEVYAQILRALGGLLRAALLVRADIPSTFLILQVASGHADAYWQLIHDLQGLAGPALFVTEAGGTVSTRSGAPWDAGSSSIVISTPGIHAAMLAALGTD